MASDLTPLRNAALATTLRSCQLFSGLPAGDLAAIADFATLRTLGGRLRFAAVSPECELTLRQHHLFIDELEGCPRRPS